MVPFLSIIALGFFLGMRHATDADHVVAVTTIVSRERTIRSSALIGILWGLGHTITIFIVGSLIILFGVVIPPRLGLTMELSVGIMLILLGILNLSGLMRWITQNFGAGHEHTHAHSHSQGLHSHSDDTRVRDAETAPSLGWMDNIFGRVSLYQMFRPLVVGVVHGLAGSAAIALLVLTTIRIPLLAMAYLLVFGLGTVAGMMLITAAIAVPFTFSEHRFARMNRFLATASGVVSLVFGLLIVYEMGFVHGLFSSHPTWTPR
jgi:high-affinity nickel-transport protein